MKPGSGDSNLDSLDAVIAEFLKCIDAGTMPDRAQFLAAHKEHAAGLQSYFADLDRMARLGADPNATIGHEQVIGPGSRVRYFGDYELLAELGRGGMGVVYRARQVSLNRPVALKMILAGQLASKADVQRFRTEAEAAANLDHPAIVPIYEVGELNGLQYFSMGHVEGGSLADRLTDGPLNPRTAASLVKTLAEAVHFAHEHGVIHRDLKPSNVLLDALGRPKVTDFGLAKRMQKSDGPTVTGDVLGTPAYMPPEQAAGTIALVGPLADVYSLGAVLYACLTGKPPFQAATPFDTLLLVVSQDPEHPSKLRRGLPTDLVNICLKCLEKNLDRRYGSAQELADDLGRFLIDEPVRAKPPGLVRRLWVWARRRPWLLAELASLGMIFAVCLAYGLAAEIRERGWTTLYWQARAARLALSDQPNVPAAAIAPIEDLLQRADQVRHDPRLYEEAVALQSTTGRGFVRLHPRSGGGDDPLPPTERDKLLVPFTWDKSGRKVLLPGAEIDATTGSVTALKVGDAIATADPTGTWLSASDGSGQVRVVHRATGRERLIDRRPAIIQQRSFIPNNQIMMVVASAEGGSRRSIEIWNLNDEQPHVDVPVGADGTLLYDISADGSRLAWYTVADKQINVFTTAGKEVAKIAHSFGSFQLSDLALSPDGSRVACSPAGWRGDEMTTVHVYDVATRQEVLRLPDTDWLTFVEAVAYSPDGRSIYGRSSRVEWSGDVSHIANRILVWDATNAELRFWVRGDGFASGAGANGDIAIRHGSGADGSQRIALNAWQPTVVRDQVARFGLDANMLLPSFDVVVSRRPMLMMWTYSFGWPTLIAGLACMTLAPLQMRNARKGLAAPGSVSAIAALAGAVTCVWMLFKLLIVFHLPSWTWWELTAYAAHSLLPLLLGTTALYQGVRNYRSAVFGDNKPVMNIKPTEETARAMRSFRRVYLACFAAMTLFILRAALDATVFVPHFGLLGAFIFTAVASLLLSGPMVVLVAGWKRVASSRFGLSPRMALVGWTLVAAAAGLWCGRAVFELVSQHAWQRLPPVDVTLNFDLILSKIEGNKFFAPTQVLMDTLTAIALALSVAGVNRNLRSLPQSAQLRTE